MHAACALMCVIFAERNPGVVAYGAWPWIEGGGAALLCALAGLPWWWLPINVLFLPAAQAMLALRASGGGLLRGVQRPVSGQRCRVAAPRAVFPVQRERGALRYRRCCRRTPGFASSTLGCGNGSLLATWRARGRTAVIMASNSPRCRFRCRAWRARRNPAISVSWGDFWSTDLARYDVVYAYLSPAAMPRLWEKARREMRPGSLFVSNGFAVPGVAATRMIPLGDPHALDVVRMADVTQNAVSPLMQQWVDMLSEARLPVLARTAAELELLRCNEDSVTPRLLADVVLHDPIMTVQVLQYLQQNRSQHRSADITTIAHALMMLGVAPFFAHFSSHDSIEARLAGDHAARHGVLGVISRARHAAHYAHDWAQLRHDIDPEEIMIAALLHDMAEILVWCYAPPLALEIAERLQRDRALRSVDVQHAVLGFRLIDLQLASRRGSCRTCCAR